MFSLAVFKDADAAKLLTGQAVSQVCDKMMSLGLIWVIVNERSTEWVPWFLAAGAFPHLGFAWSAGKWASKIGPLRSIVWTDFIRGLIFGIAALVWTSIAADRHLMALFLITVLANFASALFNPAILSIPVQLANKNLIPQVTAAIDSCFSMSNIAGPAIAAIFYSWIGLRGLFLLNSISYFFAAALEAGIHLDPSTDAGAPSEATGSIAAFLKSDSLIFFMLFTFFLMNLVLTPLMAFLPLFAKFRFAGNIGILASMEMAVGFGMVTGSIGLSVVQLKMRVGLRALIGLGVTSLMYLSFSLNHEPSWSCVFLAVLGFALSIANISLLTLFQTRVQPKDVPAVMSLVNLISVGALPFSMLLLGGLVERLNIENIAFSFALALMAITGAAFFNQELRSA